MTDPRPGTPRHRLLRAILAPFATVAALSLAFAEWLWGPLLRLARILARLPGIAAIERLIARLPPRWALISFGVPLLALFPFKVLGVYMMAHGRHMVGAMVFLAAKVVGTALCAWTWKLTSPALLTMPWFARLFGKFLVLRSALYTMVFERPLVLVVRRRVRVWRRAAMRYLTTLLRRLRSG